MGFNRGMLNTGSGLPRQMRQGDGILANISVFEVTADANQTLTIDQIAGGAINYSGFSAGRNLTVPTGAQLTAAYPDMDIGDSFSLIVSIQDAFAGTWVAASGVSISGRATTPASSWSWVVVTRIADSGGVRQYVWRVL